MKAEFFHSVCPLEIGDTVAVRDIKDKNGMKMALYMPAKAAVIVAGPVTMCKVTDILTLHYIKSRETQFMYELNGSGEYEALKVQMPVQLFDDELKKRGR